METYVQRYFPHLLYFHRISSAHRHYIIALSLYILMLNALGADVMILLCSYCCYCVLFYILECFISFIQSFARLPLNMDIYRHK